MKVSKKFAIWRRGKDGKVEYWHGRYGWGTEKSMCMIRGKLKDAQNERQWAARNTEETDISDIFIEEVK